MLREQRPFVGRRAELGLVKAALAACRETGRGQAVHVRGEAGIGKSRLIEEIQRAAEEAGFACHSALVLDFGSGAGRDAIRALARSLLGLDLTSGSEAARAAAAAALSSEMVAATTRSFSTTCSTCRSRRSCGRSTRRWTAGRGAGAGSASWPASSIATSRQHPRLLVVEDLHWADRPTLVHLAKLAATVALHPALLIMTSRVEGDPLDEAWRAEAAGTSLTTIDLGPLPSEDARALAEALIATNTSFAQRCVERAAGNPLFLDQLLRHADESHAADRARLGPEPGTGSHRSARPCG